MGYTISNVDKLMTKLTALGGNAMNAMQTAVRRTTLAGQASAKRNTTVKTGNLKEHNFVRWKPSGKRFEGIVYNNVPYAMYVEMGTSRSAAKPFLAPAAEENKGTFVKESENALMDEIRKMGK